MNGLELKGLFSQLILMSLASLQAVAELPLVAPNEPACVREKLPTLPDDFEFQISQIPFRLIAHKCDGDRCYIITDDASCGEAIASVTPNNQRASDNLNAIFESESAPPGASSPLGRSLPGLSRIPQPLPEPLPQPNRSNELIDLRVLNAELIARLEMTQAILEMQKSYTDQILLLERENGRLVAEKSELKAKSEVNEQLTASLIERTELQAKLTAAHDWISSRTAYEASIPVQLNPTAFATNPQYEEKIAAIQEDLSNLRRQLPLIKRTPVPFAISNTVSHEQPYVPLGSKSENTPDAKNTPCQSTEEANSPCREAAVKDPSVR